MKVKLSKYAKLTDTSVRTLWRRIKDGTLTVEYSKTGRVFVDIDEEFIQNIEQEILQKQKLLDSLSE